jgi:hypothetical protein
MLIIGSDYHPSTQQIAWIDSETGECGERPLRHRVEAEQFYRKLQERETRVRIFPAHALAGRGERLRLRNRTSRFRFCAVAAR